MPRNKAYNPIKTPMRLASLCVGIFLLFACSSNNSKASEQQAQTQTSTTTSTASAEGDRKFQMISIPANLTTPPERMDYLMKNYWNNFDFSDTVYMHLPEVTEQAFVDYLDVLRLSETQTVKASIGKLLDEAKSKDASGKMYPYFLDLLKQYLYDPNSPFLNEELYIPVTEYIIADKNSELATLERAKYAQKNMLKNRKGTLSADIKYTSIDGKKGSLYALNKEYTLLYLYSPDCPTCKKIVDAMKHSPLLNNYLETKRLDILTVYPDEDLDLWKTYVQNDLPTSWIRARDASQTIRNKDLYSLRALPTIYLLDRNKKVVLKDTQIQIVEEYLQSASK